MTSVEDVLDAAAAEGFLTQNVADEGPTHSAGFLAFDGLPAIDRDDVAAVDLGTGGGVPGLVLAVGTVWRWTLLDRGERRVAFLRWAIRELGLGERVEALLADAVDVGRGPLRHRVDVVTARGFAPPGPTAECAAPLLAGRGVLVVSEPPEQEGSAPDGSRWLADGLASVGLADVGGWQAGGASFRALRQDGECPDRFPRRFRTQVANPLF